MVEHEGSHLGRYCSLRFVNWLVRFFETAQESSEWFIAGLYLPAYLSTYLFTVCGCESDLEHSILGTCTE